MKKLFAFIILLLIAGIISLQFPELFIKKQFEYDAYVIYSNTPINEDENTHKSLNEVTRRLKNSAFYNPDQRFKLFFIKGTTYESIVQFLGAKQIASSKFDRHLYFGIPDFLNNKLIKNDNDFEWVNLEQIITHEAVHSQMYPNHSTLGFMNTPSWINEGYCELISYEPINLNTDYDFKSLIKKYLDTSDFWVNTEWGSMTPTLYLRDRILIEYLILQKQMTVKDIISNKHLEPEEIIKEIIKQYELE